MSKTTGLRMLLLTPELHAWGGGIATFYRDYLRAAAEQGIDTRVIEGSAFSASTSVSQKELDGIVVERLEASRLSRWHKRFAHLSQAPTFRRHLAAAWAMWEQALEGPEFDAVEATDWGLLCVPPVVAGTHPTVIQAHASCGQIASHDALRGDEASAMLIRMTELAIMSSAAELQTYSASNAQFWETQTARPVTMIRPAWRPPNTVQPSTVTKDGLVVGRLQSWKGPETLCDALRLLGARSPTVRWIGREINWPLTNVSTSTHLAKTYHEVWGRYLVHEAQRVPDEVRRLQSAALFNLVPSTWDVFNFTAAEAMASRRPTIVSTGAGASELIEHGRNGFVFPAGDPVALAAVIEEVLSLSQTRQMEIGERGFETVSRELDPQQSTQRRIERYKAAVASHAQGRHPLPQWIVEACSPTSHNQTEGEFLNHLPLRMLAKHVAHRALKRVTPL